MLKTSGLILDVHDDVNGDILRSFFPTQDSIPETIKTAHSLTSAERARLPDEDFALVLIDGDQQLRKYACIDEGNTQLAVLYFLANAEKLPDEAQKVAAANLITACEWYGIEPPEELEKTAFLGTIGKGLGLLSVPATIKGTQSQISQNMAGIKAREAQGMSVVPPSAMKVAELTGSVTMPTQPPSDRSVKPTKTVLNKTARVGHLVKGSHGDSQPLPNSEDLTHLKQPQSLSQVKAMKPRVDVTGKNPAAYAQEKKASIYALEDKFPLDDYLQVKLAATYFEEYGMRMSPEERRAYCTQLVKRADALNLPLGVEVRKYGSETYAPEGEIKMALDARRLLLTDEPSKLVLDELEEKRAMIDPGLFCDTLAEFDTVAGLHHQYDRHIPDPYYSTYGFKLAEDYSFISGNDMIMGEKLECFAKTMHKSLSTSFGEDFSSEFRKDPIGIFKSLPLAQKKMIIHMATDNAPGAEIVP